MLQKLRHFETLNSAQRQKKILILVLLDLFFFLPNLNAFEYDAAHFSYKIMRAVNSQMKTFLPFSFNKYFLLWCR